MKIEEDQSSALKAGVCSRAAKAAGAAPSPMEDIFGA